MLFFCLACESVAMKDTNAKCLPLIILFTSMCFEIMTSFVCLIPSNNYSLSVTLTHCCVFVHVCVCVHACVPAHVSTFMYVCARVNCAPHVRLYHILKAESRRQKPLMFCPSHFERNFIVNGAQKCTCLQATQGFGISHCVLAPVRHL